MADQAAMAFAAGRSMRVLIVEDEIVVALFMEDVLAGFGYQIAGVVSRLDAAMAHPADYHLAILDVRLNGQPVFAFADRLAAAGTPFIFATGYDRGGIPARHLDRPVLRKPFMPHDLKRALGEVCALSA